MESALILWALLTLLSLLFVAYDLWTNTPTLGIMRAAWLLVVLYTGPIGLFFYLLSCRQPLPGTHEQYIKAHWKQALGSEVHCIAGDATGIILAAILLSFFTVSMKNEVTIEYVAGFLFGWMIFQALFMKKMVGSYSKALTSTFIPEWLSMNMIMAGMIPVMVIWSKVEPLSKDPSSLHFWGKMSFATLIGALLAYPMNSWLVRRGLKHGMMTPGAMMHGHKAPEVPPMHILAMVFVSLAFLAAGVFLGFQF